LGAAIDEGKMKPEEYDKLTIFERAVLEEFQRVRKVLEEMKELLEGI